MFQFLEEIFQSGEFLIYRVELKVNDFFYGLFSDGWFLIYRVELKDAP